MLITVLIAVRGWGRARGPAALVRRRFVPVSVVAVAAHALTRHFAGALALASSLNFIVLIHSADPSPLATAPAPSSTDRSYASAQFGAPQFAMSRPCVL